MDQNGCQTEKVIKQMINPLDEDEDADTKKNKIRTTKET